MRYCEVGVFWGILGYFGVFWGILGYFADWRAGIRARRGTGGQGYVQGGDWRAGIRARRGTGGQGYVQGGRLESRDMCKEGDWRAGIDMEEGVTCSKELHGRRSYTQEGVHGTESDSALKTRHRIGTEAMGDGVTY